MRTTVFAVAIGLISTILCQTSSGTISGIERVGSNAFLNFPSFATHAPGDSSRLFVTELGGNIKVVDLTSSSVVATPFLNIPDTDPAGEGGLLGLAFHPNYFAPEGTTGRGKFYVYVTVDNNGDTSLGVVSPFSSHIREYTVLGDPATSNVADPASKREVLSFVQPQSNHNAGWIGFNPQVNEGQPQYLYISSGDGGGGFDNANGHTPEIGNAQDTSNLLGKMLRINVNDDDFQSDPDRNYAVPPSNPFVGEAGADEIWSYGLRNPFRNSFDRLTGDLWIGDVGQNLREEIDYQPASSNGGENYGWRFREGTQQTQNVGGPLLPSYTQPVYDYTRGSGELQGETVIGGYRYRGPDPDLQGLYFFGDASDDNVWQMTPPDPVGPTNQVVNIDGMLNNLSGIDRIVSFAEDANGNLYIIDMASGPNNNPNPNTGEVYRIITDALLPGDFNADGEVGMDDFAEWQASFGGQLANPAAGNGDSVADAADYVIWRKNLGTSVHDLGPNAVGVPEPQTTVGLLQLASLLGLAGVRRRRSRPTPIESVY